MNNLKIEQLHKGSVSLSKQTHKHLINHLDLNKILGRLLLKQRLNKIIKYHFQKAKDLKIETKLDQVIEGNLRGMNL